MFVVAASTPSSGGWADRIGGRKLFLLSVAPTLVGLLGTGFAQNIYQLLGFWCLNAIGYAMATIACQSRIAESTSGENRAQGMAVFVTAIMVAAICGTSFGGVISDRIGFRATFMVSAVMVLLAALIVANVFLDTENRTEVKRISTIKALKEASRNGRYLSLLLLGAIPAKLILTGFLFYLVPLYLADLGHSQSAIGREMMAYFAVMVIMSPMLAKVADKYRLRLSMVVSGGVIAGIGAFALPLVGQADIGVLIAVVTLGIGH
ncbi:MAG: MFS transporter, partial [Nocardia sp.]|nr:MFS transporter [Nocardia sp.]